MAGLGSCHQGDDIVANIDAGLESGIVPEVDASPLDVSVAVDAPPVTIDVAAPPVDAVLDIVIPIDVAPPIVDATPPIADALTCDPAGPIVSIQRVNMQKSEACAGQLAAHTFAYALCACEDLSVKALTTGSFHSIVGSSLVALGAPVGIAGSLVSLASTRESAANIGGSMTMAGTVRSPFVTTPLNVNGDLRIAGQVTFWWPASILRDLWLVSRVGYLAFVSVGGKYYKAPGGSLMGVTPPFISGATVESAFTVNDPCGCAERLDVAAMEATGSVDNDNAARGIDPGLLARVSGTTKLELNCGRFRFDSIAGSGILQLVIKGRTAIFVDAQVDLSLIDFQLTLDPGAELDLFVRTNLTLGSNPSLGAKLGDPARPAATRVYVGGVADIAIPAGAFGANLYAPNANLNITAPTMGGSVYGKGISVPEWAWIRYDRAILDQGGKCEQPVTCDDCSDCYGGKACVDGSCGACRTDDDCCLPLVCNAGSCQPLLAP